MQPLPQRDWNTVDQAYGLFFGEGHRRFTVDAETVAETRTSR